MYFNKYLFTDLTSFSSSDVGCWTVNTALCVEHCDGNLVECERRETVYQRGCGQALVKGGSVYPIKQAQPVGLDHPVWLRWRGPFNE